MGECDTRTAGSLTDFEFRCCEFRCCEFALVRGSLHVVMVPALHAQATSRAFKGAISHRCRQTAVGRYQFSQKPSASLFREASKALVV
jgi:hypothetical protein